MSQSVAAIAAAAGGLATSARAQAKFFAARTHLLWGKMLAERRGPGDVDKARELLTTAHTVSEANGYGTVERRSADALQMLDA